MSATLSTISGRALYFRRRAANVIFITLSLGAAVFGLIWLAFILGALLKDGVSALSPTLFTEITPPPGSKGGLSNAIFGSVLMSLGAVLVGTPIGLFAGTYLAEYARFGRLAFVVRFINDILLSAPSIITGLFIYEIVVVPMGHFSAIAGALSLTVIVIPVVVRTTENMLILVPDGLREAATALGAPQSFVIKAVTWKAAQAGIVTGVLLAIARISGETAPLLFTALGNQNFSTDITQPMASLPQVIYNFATGPYEDLHALAWAGALLVTFTVLALSIIARLLEKETDLTMDTAFHFEHTQHEIAAPPATVHADKTKIDIRDLSFFYGDNKSLKNISLPLMERKVTAFIGPSGCGKSTLLRAINRIFELYPKQRAEGEILMDGENILKAKDLNLLRARIGMVFQKPTPFPMSIYDTLLAFGIKLYERIPKSEMDGRVESALTRAALWTEVKDKLGASGLSLSGGQQQRLCIARSVATKPEVILLDEPCSALDPISTAKVEELIEELSADYTIVIVTHNMQQASRASDYTAFMYLGELIEYGQTEKIFTAPDNKKTEQYITGRFG